MPGYITEPMGVGQRPGFCETLTADERAEAERVAISLRPLFDEG
jgi:hypothetical protein